MRNKILYGYLTALNILVVAFIFLSLVKSNVLSPLLQLNLSDFSKSPLPPYRDSIARSIGEAAIYFSIIEGATSYDSTIDSPIAFVELSKTWYAPYFLLGRKLEVNCKQCEFAIVEAPSQKEATDSSKLYPFKIIKK